MRTLNTEYGKLIQEYPQKVRDEVEMIRQKRIKRHLEKKGGSNG